MEAKATLASVVAAAALAACANPTADNYHAVTNDWWNGKYTNVCELAQQRFAANSNDLVAAHIMWEYDICFSDFAAMSNSIMRLVRIADEVTLPAYTNRYQRLREGYADYLTNVIPSFPPDHQQPSPEGYPAHWPMVSTEYLRIIWDSGLWDAGVQGAPEPDGGE